MPSLNFQDSTSLKIQIVLTILIEFSVVYISIKLQYFGDRIENALLKLYYLLN